MGNNVIDIYFIKQTDTLDEALFHFFLAELPEKLQQEIKNYKHRKAAEQTLLGKILLRYAFHQLGFSFQLEDIQTDKKERPFINDSIDFNLSHSGDYVLLAITTHQKVGIDVEKHRTISKELFQRYFSEQEWHTILNAANPDSAFFDFWVMKESAIKWDGRGVEILSQTYKNYAAVQQVICAGNTLIYQPIFLETIYSAGVCSTEQSLLKLTKLSISDLQNP